MPYIAPDARRGAGRRRISVRSASWGLGIGAISGATTGTLLFPGVGTIVGLWWGAVIAVVPTLIGTCALVAAGRPGTDQAVFRRCHGSHLRREVVRRRHRDRQLPGDEPGPPFAGVRRRARWPRRSRPAPRSPSPRPAGVPGVDGLHREPPLGVRRVRRPVGAPLPSPPRGHRRSRGGRRLPTGGAGAVTGGRLGPVEDRALGRPDAPGWGAPHPGPRAWPAGRPRTRRGPRCSHEPVHR